MRNFIVVGAGEYYKKIIGPSLINLIKDGLVNILAVVDIKQDFEVDINFLPNKFLYKRRFVDQPLSELLFDFKDFNPIVLLGHSNDLHVKDMVDLVEAGFSVMVEKPYAVTNQELSVLSALLKKFPNRVVLLEYYLMMKSVPLLMFADKLKRDTFYTDTTNKLMEYYEGMNFVGLDNKNIFGKLKDYGEIKKIDIELLEGEGETGRLDQRGSYLSDKNRGGGMILDLGLHAVVSLFSLSDYIGEIDDPGQYLVVRKAFCKQYLEMAQEKFELAREDIAETYADIRFKTKKDIPVTMKIGKYVLSNQNRRHIIFYFENYVLKMDLSECFLELSVNNERYKLFSIPKKSELKYYPVLRSGVEILSGQSPFNFDLNSVTFKAQSWVLQVREKACKIDEDLIYPTGVQPEDIFR